MSLIIACLYTYGILPQELIMLTDKNWNSASWSLNVRNFVEGQKDPSGLLLTVVTVRQTERERSVGIQLICIWLVERFSMIAFAREWSPCVVKQAHLRLRYSVFLNTFWRMCLSLYSSELQQQALMLVPTWFAFRLHMYDHIMVAVSLIFMACVFVLQAAVFAHVIHDTHDMLQNIVFFMSDLFGLAESNLNMFKTSVPKQLLLPHQSMTILTKAEPKQDLPSSLNGTQLLSCSMLSHLEIGQWATGYPEVSVVSFASQKFGAIWMDVFLSNPYGELGIPESPPQVWPPKVGPRPRPNVSRWNTTTKHVETFRCWMGDDGVRCLETK